MYPSVGSSAASSVGVEESEFPVAVSAAPSASSSGGSGGSGRIRAWSSEGSARRGSAERMCVLARRSAVQMQW